MPNHPQSGAARAARLAELFRRRREAKRGDDQEKEPIGFTYSQVVNRPIVSTVGWSCLDVIRPDDEPFCTLRDDGVLVMPLPVYWIRVADHPELAKIGYEDHLELHKNEDAPLMDVEFSGFALGGNGMFIEAASDGGVSLTFPLDTDLARALTKRGLVKDL